MALFRLLKTCGPGPHFIMSIGESFSITVIPRRFPTAQGRGMGGFLWDVDFFPELQFKRQGSFFGIPGFSLDPFPTPENPLRFPSYLYVCFWDFQPPFCIFVKVGDGGVQGVIWMWFRGIPGSLFWVSQGDFFPELQKTTGKFFRIPFFFGTPTPFPPSKSHHIYMFVLRPLI